MRLLLLLSAFFAALTGVVVGPAANAQRIEASASVAQTVKPGAVAFAAVVAPVEGQAAVLARTAWHVVPAPVAAAVRPLYADRLRE